MLKHMQARAERLANAEQIQSTLSGPRLDSGLAFSLSQSAPSWHFLIPLGHCAEINGFSGQFPAQALDLQHGVIAILGSPWCSNVDFLSFRTILTSQCILTFVCAGISPPSQVSVSIRDSESFSPIFFDGILLENVFQRIMKVDLTIGPYVPCQRGFFVQSMRAL